MIIIDITTNGVPQIENPVSGLDLTLIRGELQSLFQIRELARSCAQIYSVEDPLQPIRDSLMAWAELLKQLRISRSALMGNIIPGIVELSCQLKELTPELRSLPLTQAAENALTAIEKDEDEAILSQHVESLESYMGEIPLVEDKPVPTDKLALQQTILAYIATLFALLSWLDQKLPDPSDEELIQSVRENTAVLVEIRDYLKERPESSDQSAYVLDNLCENGKKVTVSFEDFHDVSDASDQSPIPDVEHQDLESVESTDDTDQ